MAREVNPSKKTTERREQGFIRVYKQGNFQVKLIFQLSFAIFVNTLKNLYCFLINSQVFLSKHSFSKRRSHSDFLEKRRKCIC